MSLIGKKVIMSVWEEYDRIEIKGVVLDKYTGLSKEKNQMPSGQGGSITLEMNQSIDYYVIQTEKGLKHVKCSNLSEVNAI